MADYKVNIAYHQEVRGQKSASSKEIIIQGNRANFPSEDSFRRYLEKEAMNIIEGCTKATWQGHKEI